MPMPAPVWNRVFPIGHEELHLTAQECTVQLMMFEVLQYCLHLVAISVIKLQMKLP